MRKPSRLFGGCPDAPWPGGERVYFVHSFRAVPSEANKEWVLTTTTYGEEFVSSVQASPSAATQTSTRLRNLQPPRLYSTVSLA